MLNRGLGDAEAYGESADDAFARWEKASDAFDSRLDAAGVRDAPVREWPADLRAEIEQSWECVLDRANYGRLECWQAAVHVLCAEDVVEAVRIAA